MKRTPLARGSFPPQRRTPLQQASAKRRADNTERRVVVSAMRRASDGRCPRCGHTGLELHGHERIRRSQGGSIIAPDVLICDPCNTAVASSPRVSCWNGWAVSPKWPHDPALTTSQARSLTGLIVEFGLADEDVA